MDEGHVLVDGVARKASHHVASNKTLTVEIPPARPAGVEAEPFHSKFSTKTNLAVIDKPAGMIVDSGAPRMPVRVAALLNRFGAPGFDDRRTAAPRHSAPPLTKILPAPILIARTDDAHRKLVDDFRERQFEKTYITLLHGNIKGDSGSVELAIARDLRRRSRMTARRRVGREARTDWRVLLRLKGYTFIEAGLHTGRTHQIRVHFSALRCPVVGDAIYGAPRQEHAASTLLPPLNRNFLHAARIAFVHPRTTQRIEVRAPLPTQLLDYLAGLAHASS